MTFNITTKYNIGDVVYAASHYYDVYPEQSPYVIKNIFINSNNQRVYINYEIEQNGFVHRMPEGWLFPTFEECTEWCKEQNK